MLPSEVCQHPVHGAAREQGDAGCFHFSVYLVPQGKGMLAWGCCEPHNYILGTEHSCAISILSLKNWGIQHFIPPLKTWRENGSNWWAFYLLFFFFVISVVLLGNQYLHKTDNGNILCISADNGTSSVILANTTLVCWLIRNICRHWERYWISYFVLPSFWNQCLMCFFCPSFVDRIGTRQAQLHCLLTKSLLFCDTAIQRYKCTLHLRMKLENKGLGTTERLRECEGNAGEWMNVMNECKGTVKWSRQEKRLILFVSLAEETWLPKEKKSIWIKKWLESYHKENKAGWFIWEDNLGE